MQFPTLKGQFQYYNKYVLIKEPLHCDKFSLDLIALSWKKYQIYLQEPVWNLKKRKDILYKTVAHPIPMHTYPKLMRPYPKLWHQLPIGVQNLRVGYFLILNFNFFFLNHLWNKYADFSLSWPPKVKRPIAFWWQRLAPMIYTCTSNWWTGHLIQCTMTNSYMNFDQQRKLWLRTRMKK